MYNSSLSQEEFKFIKDLIAIASTGSTPVEDSVNGTLPYGKASKKSLPFIKIPDFEALPIPEK